MSDENYELMLKMSENDVQHLKDKGEAYGTSWRNRGGVGAFMMMARKVDRIENICKGHGYDIFQAMTKDTGQINDDINDLIGYLMLIRTYVADEEQALIEDYENAKRHEAVS